MSSALSTRFSLAESQITPENVAPFFCLSKLLLNSSVTIAISSTATQHMGKTNQKVSLIVPLPSFVPLILSLRCFARMLSSARCVVRRRYTLQTRHPLILVKCQIPASVVEVFHLPVALKMIQVHLSSQCVQSFLGYRSHWWGKPKHRYKSSI